MLARSNHLIGILKKFVSLNEKFKSKVKVGDMEAQECMQQGDGWKPLFKLRNNLIRRGYSMTKGALLLIRS